MRWFILYAKYGLPLFALAWAMMAVQKERGDGGDGTPSP